MARPRFATRWTLALAAALTTACGLPSLGAQEATAKRVVAPAVAPETVLEQLGDPAHAVRAIRQFVSFGAAAVPVLVKDVQARRAEPEDDFRRLMALYALGKLRGRAATAIAPLIAELPQRTGILQRQLIWALGEIGSATPVLDENLRNELAELATEPGWNRQEWHIAISKLELGAAPAGDEILAWINSNDFGKVVAAASAAAALPQLDHDQQQALDSQFARMRGVESRGGGVDRAVFDLAAAIVRHCPDSEHRMDALAALARHFDPEVRLQAFEALALSADPRAVTPLVAATAEGVRELRLEAITALGILGKTGSGASEALEQLASDADRDVAVRAAASLRAIRRDR